VRRKVTLVRLFLVELILRGRPSLLLRDLRISLIRLLIKTLRGRSLVLQTLPDSPQVLRPIRSVPPVVFISHILDFIGVVAPFELLSHDIHVVDLWQLLIQRLPLLLPQVVHSDLVIEEAVLQRGLD